MCSRAMHRYVSLLNYIKKLLNIIIYSSKVTILIDHNYILLTKKIISKINLFP